MGRSPARRTEPERRLSRREVETVLGRAIELHVRESAGDAGDLLAETELVRIADELGLPDEHLRRALAELDGGSVRERDWLARRVGARRAGSSRVLPLGVATVQQELERYLLSTECMVVERRLPGRTTYVPASGLVAATTRIAHRLSDRYEPLGADRLEVGVQPLADGSCCVAATVDLTRRRRDLVAVGALGGTLGGAAASLAAAALVAPPLAVVGVPVLAAALAASRLAYRGAVAETVGRIDSVLDRLEHRELVRPRGRMRLLRV